MAAPVIDPGREVYRRRELAHFLRRTRERTTPTQLGLPGRGRRRTPGLRREEVAVLAGLSPTWYTYLEQARPASPSVDLVDNLADALGMTGYERGYLRALADPRPAPAPPPAGSTDPVLLRVVNSVDALPTYLTTELGDVLGWNAAAEEWYSDFGAVPVPERNIVWWMLTTAEARHRVVDWAQEARELVGMMRVSSLRWYGEPRYTALFHALWDCSAPFREWWDEHEVQAPGRRVRRLRHPEHGVVSMVVVLLAEDPARGVKVVTHVPA